MSCDPGFEAVVRAALVTALADDPGIGPLLNRVGDGEGESAGFPHAQVGEIATADVGAKGLPGREARCTVSLFDRGPPDRLIALAGAAQVAITDLPRVIGAWRTSGALILRTRLLRRKDGTRIALIDIAMRGWLFH
jgi:hypothetical protein